MRPSPAATSLAENEGVDVRTYRVIYKVTEDITAALVGMLKPTIEEVVLGQAQVRTTFKASKLGTIAGCMVTHGTILRNANMRVLRNDVVVHDGKMPRSSASPKTRARSRKASNAASCSTASTTSKKGTCWRRTRPEKSPVRSDACIGVSRGAALPGGTFPQEQARTAQLAARRPAVPVSRLVQ